MFVQRFQLGGLLTALLTVIALWCIKRAYRASRGMSAESIAMAPPAPRQEAGQAVASVLIVALVVFVAIQLVPVARTNPPALDKVKWDSQQTGDLADRACMNCHSNETRWPWYSYVAPASWLVVLHVDVGRAGFNLSEMNNIPEEKLSNLGESCARRTKNGNMPPKDFLILHPEARLTDAEKQQLEDGFKKSLPK